MIRAYPRHMLNINKKTFALAFKMLFSKKAIQGESIQKFEKQFADYIGVKHAIGVGSARKGLYLIFKSLILDKNDEIIMPSYTFHALPMAVIACGLKPVFIDVNPDTYNIDPSLIEGKITNRTKAIVLTHMFGQPCDMDEIIKISQKFNLIVIEDCAHACGAKYKNKQTGSIGDVAIFSFKMGKNLPCFGGGIITTNNETLYSNIKETIENEPYPTRKFLLKNIFSTFIFYCVTQRNIFTYITYPLMKVFDFFNLDWADSKIEEKKNLESSIKSFRNQAKLTNLQAAVGIPQLARLESVNEKRRINAQTLINELRQENHINIPFVIPDTESTYLYFRIRVKEVNVFRKKLLNQGIDTKRDDMSACSNLKVFERYRSSCPVSEKLPLESIEIPNNSFMSKEDVLYIAEKIKDAIGG